MPQRDLEVPEGLDGRRADAGLAALLGISRTRVTEALDAGGGTMDGRSLGRADSLRAGAWLEFAWDEAPTATLVPTPVDDLGIIAETDDYVVVDKPVGVAAHPSVGWTGPTVVGAVAAAGFRVATSGAAERQGVVHRLDVGTSGLMVVAKSERGYTDLKRQFHDREVDKIYHAVVQGHPDPLVGTIDAPIGRAPGSGAWKFAVTSDGKHAVTHYTTLEAFRGASLLEIELETGRTHQIRVHMAAQRHPCAGDVMYGADPSFARELGLERQWLHAMRLGFSDPTSGEHVEFESVYPADLQHALDVLAGADAGGR